MNENIRKPFNKRAFASLMMALSGVGLVVTGLSIADPDHGEFVEGYVSRGLHAWTHAHIAYALVFLGFAVWHISLNRRVLMNYVRGLGSKAPLVTREAACATAIIGLVTLLMACLAV